MKILSSKAQTFAIFFLTLLIFFSLNSPAFAIWRCVQGSSGQLYDSSLLDTSAEPRVYYVWGMGYYQKPNSTNWVIFPISSTSIAIVQSLIINLKTVTGGDIYVDRIAVWSGDTQLGEDIAVNWSGSDLGWQSVDLGTKYRVNGISISLRTQTGNLGGMLQVHSVCADFGL